MTEAQAATTTEDPEKGFDPLKFIIAANHGHLQGIAEHRWCEFGRHGRALRFDQSGMARLGNVFGWIEGLASAGKADIANPLAIDIVRALDALSTYGGQLNSYHPRFIVSMRDDGLLNCWSLLFYTATPLTKETDLTKGNPLRDRKGVVTIPELCQDVKPHYYPYDHNGGLLYHGPNGDNVLAVDFFRKDHRFWSVHT